MALPQPGVRAGPCEAAQAADSQQLTEEEPEPREPPESPFAGALLDVRPVGSPGRAQGDGGSWLSFCTDHGLQVRAPDSDLCHRC